jgi:membrane-associated phospholipid phosphatase
MRALLYRLPRNIANCFRGYKFAWHILAVAVTYILVASGFDWFYFESTRSAALRTILFPAVLLGGILPVLVPLMLLAAGKIKKNQKIVNAAWALGQAALIGLLISSFYKAFTGRVQPSYFNSMTDISRDFMFGFFRHGVFWGWPSSHTTVAFAGAVTLCVLYRSRKSIAYAALIYAFYVGFGVSISIHWFSDFVAGVIIGTVIGVVVGKSFLNRFLGERPHG